MKGSPISRITEPVEYRDSDQDNLLGKAADRHVLGSPGYKPTLFQFGGCESTIWFILANFVSILISVVRPARQRVHELAPGESATKRPKGRHAAHRTCRWQVDHNVLMMQLPSPCFTMRRAARCEQ
jgi:hypothetical protein